MLPRRGSDRGASAVEFALVLPVLLLLAFGIVDYGIFLGDSLAAQSGVREAARQGVVQNFGTCSPVSLRCLADLTRERTTTVGARQYVKIKVSGGAWTRGNDLTVRVHDHHRDRAVRGSEHGGDDGEGLVVGHFDEKKGARAPSRNGCGSTERPPENGNCNATRTTSEKPMMTAIAPAPIAWNDELFDPTSVA